VPVHLRLFEGLPDSEGRMQGVCTWSKKSDRNICAARGDGGSSSEQQQQQQQQQSSSRRISAQPP